MKKLIIFLITLLVTNVYSQDQVDIGTPANSPFNLGSDIQGTIQNSVNEVTGKVTFSVTLGAVAASSVSYGVNLTYNGATAFKNGQQTNKYNPTSVVGVGWSLNAPKIVVDNKDTGTRDDDDFYLLDGVSNTKMFCNNRGTTTNGSIWEFTTEKYKPWKIKFHYHTSWGDYWEIVNESGITYYYGNPTADLARDYVIRYGNWIGNSVQFGATDKQTIEWNLYKIEDQWGNNVIFEYDKTTQTMSGLTQTEASYLKKITASNGTNIQLSYTTKAPDEFYEPYQVGGETDAYQERYETKYLQSVSSYNTSNQLVSTYNIGYTLNGTGLNTKRYLTSLTQTSYNNGQDITLPSQEFQYHYTGTFKGGLSKIIYPTGGSVTYNYNNKLLFENTANLHESSFSIPSGFEVFDQVVKDNYILCILRSLSPVSGSNYTFKIFRFWWDGMQWKRHEFTFPHTIFDGIEPQNKLRDFYAVLENDFYGFLYDKGTTADLYLFHLEKDGRTWNYETYQDIYIGNEEPRFISSHDFVAVGSHRTGQLHTYVWNGLFAPSSPWNYKLINQGSGQHYMAATNNYIISMDEDGGSDMVTGIGYTDNYYIHYLDAERQWQTKSWSAAADPYVTDTQSPSYFYPSNSIIGFVADYNPELFLRWDTNYNLTHVDDFLGSYNDSSPFQPVGNSMFTLYKSGNKDPYKTAVFNGINWSYQTPTTSYNYADIQFDNDLLTYQSSDSGNSNKRKFYMYDPNTNGWDTGNFMLLYNNVWYPNTAINPEFMVVGHGIYKRNNQLSPPALFPQIGSINNNEFAYSDGLSHTFVIDNIDNTDIGKFYYMDKKDGVLKNINLGNVHTFTNSSTKFGQRIGLMSTTSLLLRDSSQPYNLSFYRIIDDEVNNDIYDIVVDHLDIDDDNETIRKIQYTYNTPSFLPNNSSAFYGEVIVENKGLGNGIMGKVKKIYNNGDENLLLAGLPQEVHVLDVDNKLKNKTTTTWQLTPNPVGNGTFIFEESYYILNTINKEESFFGNSPSVVKEITNSYNNYGLKTSSLTSNSQSLSEKQEITYAYEQYTFVNDKNMLSFPYKITNKISNSIVNVEQTNWVNVNSKVYLNENWSGPSISNLRLNSQVSKVESTTGNVLENNNGKGLYNSVLFGYNNLYEVATISNAEYQDVIDELDVTYAQLQSLSTANLKTELLKLYDRLPGASIALTFYDNNGRVISRIDGRKKETFVYYDTAGRLDYITNNQGFVIEKKEYHFAN